MIEISRMGFLHAVILGSLLCMVASKIYIPCPEGEFVQQKGCTCWNPQEPEIRCTNLGLTTIPNITKVHSLDLSDNNISVLVHSSFYRFSGLKHLKLSGNKIRAIHWGVFNGGLETLDLSGNELSEVPEAFSLETGRVLTNLSILSLANNYILSIEGGDFKGVKKLQQLDLEGNPIISISLDAWQGLDKLRTLQLSPGGLDVARIPTENLDQLTALGLCNGRPQKLDHLKPWFEHFPNLQHLKLIQMGISDEHLKGSFPEAWKLQLLSISLSDNLIANIPWRLLELPRLQEIDLSKNMLTTTADNRLYNVPQSIRKFNISNNEITYVDERLFLRWPLATSVDFSNNKVQLTNGWKLSDIDQYMSTDLVFHLGNNPFYCGCGYAWMKDLVNRQLNFRNGHLTLYEINNTFRCGPRGKHNGDLVKDVPRNVFDCSRGRGK